MVAAVLLFVGVPRAEAVPITYIEIVRASGNVRAPSSFTDALVTLELSADTSGVSGAFNPETMTGVQSNFGTMTVTVEGFRNGSTLPTPHRRFSLQTFQPPGSPPSSNNFQSVVLITQNPAFATYDLQMRLAP